MARVLCIGHAVQDFVFHVDEMPGSAEKYRARRFESVGGGPAATAAVAIQKLGGEALLAARIGDDTVGKLALAELQAFGVDCSLIRRQTGVMTSISAVIVDGRGERVIVNYADAAMESEPESLPNKLPDSVSAVLVDTRWPEGALHGLTLAANEGLPAILDADSPVPRDGKLIRAATHVAFSAAGLCEFSGLADPETGLREAVGRTDAWCCVTLGADGTLHLEDGQVHRTPAFAVDVSDTLGAGDVWHGAFALALAERQPLRDAIVFANAAAALKVKSGGGRAGSPERTEVEQLLQQHRREIGA